MNPELSVLLQIDVEANYLNVAVTGHLTETNQRALYPLIRRARALVPGIRITLDLSGARFAEAADLELLCWSIEQADPERSGDRVGIGAARPGRPVPLGPFRSARHEPAEDKAWILEGGQRHERHNGHVWRGNARHGPHSGAARCIRHKPRSGCAVSRRPRSLEPARAPVLHSRASRQLTAST